MTVPFVADAYRGNPPINYFPAADADRGVIMFGSPGLKEMVTPLADVPVREMRNCGAYLYTLCGNTAYSLDSHLTATELGNVTNASGNAWIEYNGDQVAFCDGEDLFTYTESTATWAQVTDADLPTGNILYLTYQDGYGIFSPADTHQFWLTDALDFTSITALNFASAEAAADHLIAGKSHYRELWLGGPNTTEIWENTGASTFAFERVTILEQGLGAAKSYAIGDNVIYWLAHNGQVMAAVGYQPVIISTRKMEQEVQGYSTIADAIGFIYVDEGHTFYQITFPTANTTWVYDAATKAWHKRTSFIYPDVTTQGRHRANCYARFANKHLVGDYLNGKIYEMSRNYYDDDGEELIATLESGEVRKDPTNPQSIEGQLIQWPGLQIYFEHGTGLESGQGSDPQAMLTYSNNGGRTWGPEIWADMGQIGEYGVRSLWRQMGSSFSRIFKLSVSDPVNRNIISVNWM